MKKTFRADGGAAAAGKCESFLLEKIRNKYKSNTPVLVGTILSFESA